MYSTDSIDTKKNIFRYNVVSLIIALLLILMIESLFFQYSATLEEELQNESVEYAQAKVSLIQEDILQRIYVVESMYAVLVNNNYDPSSFDEWSPIVFESVEGISSIQLAPEGVVKYVYPLEGNEGAIGHDLLLDKNRDDGARVAIESDNLIFIGPITLIQNGKEAIIIRKPIFTTNDKMDSFWGFSTVVLLIEDMRFDSFFDEDIFDYLILGFDPDNDERPYIYGNTDVATEYDSKVDISLTDGLWQLFIKRKSEKNIVTARVMALFLDVFAVLLVFRLRRKRYNQEKTIYRLLSELRNTTQIDSLTQIYNRSYFEKIMVNELERHKRYSTKDSLIMFDVDYFKKVNDKYGHQKGDEVLVLISAFIMDTKRATDVFARWGGEEFVIFLPHTDGETAFSVAEKFREAIENGAFLLDEGITASFGVCEISDESYTDLFRKVDNAVYLAKERGRNQTVFTKIHDKNK